jgi:hypothetical protein
LLIDQLEISVGPEDSSRKAEMREAGVNKRVKIA